jgi:hypothetical protein
MNITITSLRVALVLMLTPAFCYMVMFILILHSGKDQLVLIMLTSAISFYAGMASTSSTMMTGKDFFHDPDDELADAVQPPSKVTKETKTTVETADPTSTPGVS